MARRGACGADLSENIFTTKKLTNKKESHGHHFRNTAVIPRTSSECSEDDQVLLSYVYRNNLKKRVFFLGKEAIVTAFC